MVFCSLLIRQGTVVPCIVAAPYTLIRVVAEVLVFSADVHMRLSATVCEPLELLTSRAKQDFLLVSLTS